jgi:hypothetical protein
MLVEVGGPCREFPVGEGHVLGVEEPSRPPVERRSVEYLVGADEWHAERLGRRPAAARQRRTRAIRVMLNDRR